MTSRRFRHVSDLKGRKLSRRKPRDPRNYWAYAFSAGILAGIGVGLVKYQDVRADIAKDLKKVREGLEGLDRDSKRNSFTDSPNTKTLRETIRETFHGGYIYSHELYRKALKTGGWRLGDIQWIYMREMFDCMKLPFTRKYANSRAPTITRDLYLLGKKDEHVRGHLRQWMDIRLATFDDAPKEHITEKVLWNHIARELKITEKREELKKKRAVLETKSEQLPIQSAKLGAITSSTVIIIAVIAQLTLSIHRALVRWRIGRKHRKDETPERTIETRIPEPDPRPSPALVTKSQTSYQEPKEPVRVPTYVLVENAVERLSEVFGSDIADAIIDVFKEKFSATLARKIIEGDYSTLLDLLIKSKKALEVKGHDPDAIIQTIKHRR